MKIFKIRRRSRRSQAVGKELDADPAPEARMMELAATVQKALRVGAALEAREAGRRAFAELMKSLTPLSRPEEPSMPLPEGIEVADAEKTMQVSGLRTALRRLRKRRSPS